jgi:hypothetical protein
MRGSRICTRVVALVTAYAVALHAILLAFSALPIAAGASGEDSSRFELCLHNIAGGGFAPQAPSAPARGDVHCKFCVAQGHSMGLAPDLATQVIHTMSGEPIAFVAHEVIAGFPRYLHKQPRGPPAVA